MTIKLPDIAGGSAGGQTTQTSLLVKACSLSEEAREGRD